MDNWAILIIVNCAVWGLVLGLVNWWRYSDLKRKVKKARGNFDLLYEGHTRLSESYMKLDKALRDYIQQEKIRREYEEIVSMVKVTSEHRLAKIRKYDQNCRVGKGIPVSEDTNRGEGKEVTND